MYGQLSITLPDWSLIRGYNILPPVFFIDEAIHLQYLLQDYEGSEVLNDFYALVVENLK